MNKPTATEGMDDKECGDGQMIIGDPWIRIRTAPSSFAPLKKNKITVSLPASVAAKEDKLKLLQKQKIAINNSSRQTRSSSTTSFDDASKAILSPSRQSPQTSPETSQIEEEFEELSIRVFQKAPTSMFEFKSTTRFNIGTALSMGMRKRALNVYGETCAPIELEKDLLEVEIVEEQPEPLKNNIGPEGSEYGQEERLAARKLRLKRRRRTFPNGNPKLDMVKEEISLKVQDELAHYHKMKGNPRKMNDIQGSYYALIPDDESGELHAHPVKDWCSFDHVNKNVPLTEEEAEETYLKRDKILNMFSVMVEKRMKGAQDVDEDEEDGDVILVKDTHTPKKKIRKVRLDDSQDSDVEIMENGDSNDSDY